MPLNEFGKIAVADVVLYALLGCIALYIMLKKGFSRNQGWLFLFLFAQVRLIGGIVTIVLQVQGSSTGLFVAATVLQGVGLSPLLMATLSFISRIARYTWNLNNTRLFHLLHLILIVGLVMGILGGIKSKSADTISQGHTYFKVANILFLIGSVSLFGVHMLVWTEKPHIPMNYRKLLVGISLTTPFLFVRVIYSLLNSFSLSARNRWSPLNGTWWVYFIMGVLMEYFIIFIHVITWALTHPDEDKDDQES